MNAITRPGNLFLFLLLFSATSARCCINEYRVLLNGRTVYADGEDMTPSGRFRSAGSALLALHESDSIYRLTHKTEDYSDYGAMLTYNGQYLAAKQVFLEIEAGLPGLYATAANLGTVYELLGQNDSALFWIKKAITINPDSHEGSEWIHVRILEAKIAAGADNNYYATHNLLAVDFGEAKKPVSSDTMDLAKLRYQLYHQLSERLTFIKPQDPIMAQLLFQLGNVNALTWDVKSALQVYKVARAYGYTSPVLDKREKHFRSLQWKADIMSNSRKWAQRNPFWALLLTLATGVLLLAGLVWLIKRIRKRLP